MSEVYPSDNALLNLVSENETGVEYIETGKAPYYVEFRRLLYRLLLATRRANDLRVFDEGGLNVGVKAGSFRFGSTRREYGGSSGNALTDNASNYIYLDGAGALQITSSGFPAAGVFHVRLAEVTTSNGDITAIADKRGDHLWSANVTGAHCVECGSEGGVTFILKATLTGGNTVAIHNSDAPFKYRVIDGWSVAASGDGGSWKLDDGNSDISDTVAVTAADKVVDRMSSIDDAVSEVAAGGTLRVVGDGSNADAEVYVLCMRVA